MFPMFMILVTTLLSLFAGEFGQEVIEQIVDLAWVDDIDLDPYLQIDEDEWFVEEPEEEWAYGPILPARPPAPAPVPVQGHLPLEHHLLSLRVPSPRVRVTWASAREEQWTWGPILG